MADTLVDTFASVSLLSHSSSISSPSTLPSNTSSSSPSSSLSYSERSNLTPNKERAVQSTLTFSSASPSNAINEKWFVDINNNQNKNYTFDTLPATIYDLRGQEDKTHVDINGFEAFTSPSSVDGAFLLSSSEEEVARVYYPEVEKLIKDRTGASRVVFFDHTIRKATNGTNGASDPTTRQPVMQAHVDQTPLSAHKRVTRHVQPPVPFKRFQLINVWRPISNTVHDYPLAVCDFNSVDVINDLEPTTLVYAPPTPNGETYSIKHNKNQVWWYWSEMTPDDVIMLKCYDSASRELTRVVKSAADVDKNELRDVAGLTPHTAFRDEEGAKKGIKRQSIEVRALVFYD